jgi:hypothetical protein
MLRLVAVDDEIHLADASRGEHAGEHRRALPERLIHRVRDQIEPGPALRHAAGACRISDRHELFGMRHIELAQEHRVDQREDGCIRPDTQGERQDDNE